MLRLSNRLAPLVYDTGIAVGQGIAHVAASAIYICSVTVGQLVVFFVHLKHHIFSTASELNASKVSVCMESEDIHSLPLSS